MRILIPGGSGQIGTLLARHLHLAGHEVTVLSRGPSQQQQRSFMRILRRAWGRPMGLPAPLTALVAGAFLKGTETELVLKSRWVVPTLLRRHGFQFRFPLWTDAAANLVARARAESPS